MVITLLCSKNNDELNRTIQLLTNFVIFQCYFLPFFRSTLGIEKLLELLITFKGKRSWRSIDQFLLFHLNFLLNILNVSRSFCCNTEKFYTRKAILRETCHFQTPLCSQRDDQGSGENARTKPFARLYDNIITIYSTIMVIQITELPSDTDKGMSYCRDGLRSRDRTRKIQCTGLSQTG